MNNNQATIKPKKKIKNIKYFNNTVNELHALTNRLFIQSKRRPATLISGIIQPLLWLILFGALFQNAPVDPLTSNLRYSQFLSPGIIIFTAFTGSINAGLPLMFDREFGFLNRILVSPLKSKASLINSLIIFTAINTIAQTSFIAICSLIMLKHQIKIISLILINIIIFLLILSIASLSISLACTLPGHIELLACLLIINLPILFSSTALAPLSFMPTWLQILARINPLTYAIESVRKIYFETNTYSVINIWQNINWNNSLYILILIAALSMAGIQKIILHKFE
uniref:Hypothetical chloroplast RF38 n=1 Tax=Gastroclonium compressum TaxID=1852973 RepID=A0A173G080_GASCM|nr:hypothetical chloroplast RF38 [Coeloseira compressa]ANH09685.1 hypothetical chloroplast RF38 [Coeloseira compressa]